MSRFHVRHATVRAMAIAVISVGCAAGLSRNAGAEQEGPQTTPRRLEARVQTGSRQTAPVELDRQRAQEVRRELRTVMDLYPPALARILRLDPTLMANGPYLAPYPALVTFLQQHPEVPRYTEFFLDYAGQASYDEPADAESRVKRQAMDMWRDVLTGLMVFSIFLTIVLTLSWLVRYIVSHRRWLRSTLIQSDAQKRLMERLGSNEDLLAYMQSPAGQQFLQPLPVAADAPQGATFSAPLGRILWSIQTGLVVTCGGIGLLVVRQYVIEEVGQMMLVLGVLAISLGVGFGLAASASYLLSHRLGLFDAPRTSPTKSE